MYAAITTIINPGSWDDPGIWFGGEIADNITEDVVINNNIGEITILGPDNYIIGDLQMNNSNTLTVSTGSSLTIGSLAENHNLIAGNSTTLNVDGTLAVWGTLNILNGIATIVTNGILTVHGDLILGNNIVVEIQGTVIVNGDFNGGNNTDVNVDGTLTINGDVDLGTDSDLTGSGTVNITGGCTGPASFCTSGPLDDILPVISNCPTNITVSVTAASCDAVVNWTEPKATDNVGIASFPSTHNPGDTFPIGTTTVTYTATDVAGNFTKCIFNVTVIDNTTPVITNCPADIVVNLSGGLCDEVVNWALPIASDNCSVASFNSTHSSGDGFPVGTSVVSYIATDPAGNMTICTFNVTVVDTTPPVFDSCPTTWSIAPFDLISQTSVVTWQEPIASDNCSVVVTSNFKSGDGLPAGLTKVIYTATDDSGNTATCEFDVTVIGNRVPIGSPMVIEAFTGEPKEFCLDVRDPDGDVLTVIEIDDGTLNGVLERAGSVDNLCFIYTSFDGFEGEELIVFTVCDNGTPEACIKVEVRINVALDLRLKIYKAFTPDGDNINDLWVIENIQNYPNNQVMIYDRLGGLIFSARNYDNKDIVWDGRSNQNGQNILPTGTYFYKIDLGDEVPIQKGFIELVN